MKSFTSLRFVLNDSRFLLGGSTRRFRLHRHALLSGTPLSRITLQSICNTYECFLQELCLYLCVLVLVCVIKKKDYE